MGTLKQFGDKHISMDTHGQQYNTTIYNINFELGHTTIFSHEGTNYTNRYGCGNIEVASLDSDETSNPSGVYPYLYTL
jgi:hypothetical protein